MTFNYSLHLNIKVFAHINQTRSSNNFHYNNILFSLLIILFSYLSCSPFVRIFFLLILFYIHTQTYVGTCLLYSTYNFFTMPYYYILNLPGMALTLYNKQKKEKTKPVSSYKIILLLFVPFFRVPK